MDVEMVFFRLLKKKGISGTGIEIDEANSQKLVSKKINFFRNINEVSQTNSIYV